MLFFNQTLHALLALHTRPFCALWTNEKKQTGSGDEENGSNDGVDSDILGKHKEKIVGLCLYTLNKYQHIPTIIWSIVTNLNSLCTQDLKCAEYIDLWRLGTFKIDKNAGNHSVGAALGVEDDEEDEDEDEEEDGRPKTPAEISDDDNIDDDSDGEGGGEGTGCKILMNGLIENEDKVEIQEQYMRLFINVSQNFNCRMSLLRVDAFDKIDEIKMKHKSNKGYTSLVNRCQLALETGNVF